MADVVQYRLERMTNELDDLERRGLFTRREIAEIVKQRRKFEYRLKRPSPLKQDFITYIEYESRLDDLRRLRKKAAARDHKREGKTKTKLKNTISDYAAVTRIVEIYRLATMRYKGDIELWFRYLEFCKQKRNGRMKKILAQVVRFHPKVPGIWIYAAAWEFDHNLNVAAARALMQNGLRMCPGSEDLWIEYLRMELTYLNKLKSRKVALGEDTGTLVRKQKDVEEDQWKEENEDLFMSIDDEGKENKDVQDEETEEQVDFFSEQGSSILQTIYWGAIKAVPTSISLRKQFLEILEAVELAHSSDLRNEILSDMKRDFSADPGYWDWLARLETPDQISMSTKGKDSTLSQFEKAVQVYEEAINTLPSAEMFNLYTKFLMEAIASEKVAPEFSDSSCHTSGCISRILMVYERAELIGSLSEELACDYILFYEHIGRVDNAKKLAEKLCTENFSESVRLWILRATLEVRSATENSLSINKEDYQTILKLLKGVLTKSPIAEAESLWLMALKLFSSQKKYFKKLVEISLTSVTKHGGSEDGFSLPVAVVNFVLQKDGLQHARETYKRFLSLPHPGLALYKHCIELESNNASLGDKDSLSNARKLYEAALSTYDQNASLWKDYYAMEIKLGTSEAAAAVSWRARKALKDSAVVFSSTNL